MSTKAAPKDSARASGARAGRARRQPAVAKASRLAQVRLRPEEMEQLQEVMRTLDLGSTSDALREGLRLLVREALEKDAADEIRGFYGGVQSALPEGVAPAEEAELAAADESEW